MKQTPYETPIWLFPPAKEFKEELPKLLKKIESFKNQENEADTYKSVRNGWRKANIHLDPNLKILNNYMRWLIAQALKDTCLGDLKDCRFSSWLNAHNTGGYNTVHHHGIAALSGVIYLHAPEGSGALHLRDPRPGAYFGKQLVSGAGKDFVVQPKDGLAVLFPGFIEHWVEPSNCSGRISIAFNATPNPFDQ